MEKLKSSKGESIAEVLVASLVMAAEHRASDVHLSAGVPPKFRIDSLLYNAENTEPLTYADCLAYAERLAGERFKEVEEIGSIDLSETISGHRIRINLYHSHGI